MLTRIQNWINENSALAAIVTLIVLAIGGFFIYRSATSTGEQRVPWPKAYAYDLNSKAVYTSPRNVLPPMETKSSGDQPAGVWAQVFSCGDCANESDRFVGWLEKFNEPTKASIEEMLKPMKNGYGDFNPLEVLSRWDQSGLLVADPANPANWFPQTGEEAAAIQSKARERCGVGELKQCQP